MEPITIQYIFSIPNAPNSEFFVHLDPQTLSAIGPDKENLPAWTKLDFHQCKHCTLTLTDTSHCPVAANITDVVTSFDGMTSFDKVHAEVITAERTITQETTIQRGIGSLMGLIFATSGCPHMKFFKPMARFHLPFASEEETMFRATSMYLLAQYFRHDPDTAADFSLDGLGEIYSNIQIVNTTLAERLRAATESDSSLNAVIFLDMYARAMPYVIKDKLEELRHLFMPFLS